MNKSHPESGSDPTSPTTEVVSTSGSGPTAAPAEQASRPRKGSYVQTERVSDSTPHVAQHPASLGINPDTVIIQPPAPTPEPPTGRAEEHSVTKAELAEQLHVSLRTIDRWVAEGILPAPVRQGRGQMATRFQADAALLYWQERSEEARKERRHRQRNRRNLPQDGLTRESRDRRDRRPGSSS